MIVGIDNGLDGGLCAIAKFDGSIIDKIKMPAHCAGKKREINIRAIHDWLTLLHSPFILAIEEPLAHAKSSQAIRSMALSFGKLLGMAEGRDYPVARITVQKWQKKMLGRIPRGQTKAAALKAATALAPDECWLANNRCRVAHDGIVDAYLVAQYFRTL